MTEVERLPSYLEPLAGFKPAKAAQLCAYLSLKSRGCIEKLKLIKLIYFCERAFLSKYSETILWDELYSLPHGPICSATLNCIDGVIALDVCRNYISKNGNLIYPTRVFTKDDLDELSEAEFEVADAVWHQLGRKSASQLRNHSHAVCPEYTEVDRGRVPISYEAVLEAVGRQDAVQVAAELEMHRRIVAQFS